MIKEGIIQADGSVKSYDGNIYWLPQRGHDKEGYPEVLLDSRKVGGRGSFIRQSVKAFVGMKVKFSISPNLNAYNFEII